MMPLIAAVFVIGCSDTVEVSTESPGKPATPAQPQVSSKLLTGAEEFRMLLLDAQQRVLPGLPDGAHRAEFVASLDVLAAALLKGPITPISAALGKVGKSMDDYVPALEGDSGAQADFDAIRLTIDAIARQVATDLGTGN